jgi:hypothetical protein
MTDERELPDVRRVQIHATDKYILLESASGYIVSGPDPAGYRVYLDPDTSSEVLGSEFFRALSGSRILDVDTERDLFLPERVDREYKLWIEELKSRFGYGSRRAALKDVKYCAVRKLHGEIVFMPHEHPEPEMWRRLDDKAFITIPENATPDQAGAAIRLALSRCS